MDDLAPSGLIPDIPAVTAPKRSPGRDKRKKKSEYKQLQEKERQRVNKSSISETEEDSLPKEDVKGKGGNIDIQV